MGRSAMFFALILALAASCSFGGEDKSTIRAQRLTSPLVAMSVASSIDGDGRAVDPSYTFEPDQPQIVVVVQTGKVTGSRLEIVWYQKEDNRRVKLFEHALDVKSYDRAYSTAKNPGTLASGTYVVEATVEGTSRAVEWDVAGEAATATSAQGAGPAQPPKSGGAPVAGTSGTAAQTTAAGTAGTGCKFELVGESLKAESETDLEANRVAWGAHAEGCSAAVVLTYVDGAVNDGPYELVGNFNIAGSGAAALALAYVNPCSFDEGSDRPGTKVQFRLTEGGDPPRERATLLVALGEDSLAPRALATFTPPDGTRVKRGDKIKMEIVARERRKGGPWQSGLAQIQAIGPEGVIGKTAEFPELRKKACDDERLEQRHEVIYKVPRNSAAVIELCAIAEDFVGQSSRPSCGRFPTTDVWEGTVRSHSSFTIPSAGTCSAEYETQVKLRLKRNGKLSGTAQATATKPPACNFPRARAASLQSVTFAVSGRIVGDRMVLQFKWKKWSPKSNFEHAGFVLFGRKDVVVPIVKTGVARGRVTDEEALTKTRVESLVTVTCEGCG
jgi:hypothetical protein